VTWIKTVAPDVAEGELKEIYDAIGAARGGVADIHRVQSLNPRALRAHLELYKSILFQRSMLERRQRERIAIVVSHANHCAYCIAHHGQALRNLGEDGAVVEALTSGVIPDVLAPADRALLSWGRAVAQGNPGGRVPMISERSVRHISTTAPCSTPRSRFLTSHSSIASFCS
jgi:uncharacterized peroxidase-related enzyme